MIEIKAEQLRVCDMEFPFILNGEQENYSGIFHGEISYRRHCGFLEPTTLVEVDAEEYEKACISRIKEVLVNVKKVVKTKNGVFAMQAIFQPIKCDPRPHESEYEINL